MIKAGLSAPRSADAPFGLTYSQLEDVLVTLTDGKESKITSRFRKLRPKFAADDLLTKTGNHVRYDLPRVLSIAAIFTINALGIPQSHAVEIVVSNWLEIARASIAAFREGDDAGSASHEVRLYIDALDEEEIVSWAGSGLDETGLAHIVLAPARIIEALTACGHRDGQSLEAAFISLEEEFGWEPRPADAPIVLPARIESAFFGTGPYFHRAKALMDAESEGPITLRQRLRLQTYLDYLEAPAPVDAWKQFIGIDGSSPRLVHILGAKGASMGLRSKNVMSETLISSFTADDDFTAELIALGERAQREIASRR